MAFYISSGAIPRMVAVIGTSVASDAVKHGFTGYCDDNCGSASQISSPAYGQKWTCSKAGRYRITFTQENNGKANKWYGRIVSNGTRVVDLERTEKKNTQYHGVLHGPYEYNLVATDSVLVAQTWSGGEATSAVVAVIEAV